MRLFIAAYISILLMSSEARSQVVKVSVVESAMGSAVESTPEPDFVCAQGCNDFMKSVLKDFQSKGKSIDLTPSVYSGECHHLSDQYDGNRTEYSVVMIDQLPKKLIANKDVQLPKILIANNDDSQMSLYYFSTIFSFYAGNNEFADWNLSKSQNEMSPYWLDHGQLQSRSESETRYVRINYDDGNPAYIYYLRQDPISKDLYYITVAGSSLVSFCKLGLNK